MSGDEGGFFGRWSRRKSEVRSGAVVPVEAPAPAVVGPAAVAVPATSVAPEPSPVTPEPSAAPEPPPLTLDDVRQLTPDADFTPFVARGVAPEVRNAAFKKLFADPRFNVMDGLDIYIDDYSKPDPLPVSLARQLVSARSLGLFEEQPQPSAKPVPHTDLSPAAPTSAPSVDAAPVELSPVELPPAAEPDTTSPPPAQP